MRPFLARFRVCQARNRRHAGARAPGNAAHKGGLNMDSNIQRSVRSLALLSVLAGTIALTTGRVAISGGASGQQSPNSRAQQIQGAWVLHVSAHDCQTGTPEATFQSIVTFAQGGTLTNVTTGGSPALRTTGLGTWERAGAHEFTARRWFSCSAPPAPGGDTETREYV
jgi:hypothetical protein